jgi:hypothetical protein
MSGVDDWRMKTGSRQAQVFTNGQTPAREKGAMISYPPLKDQKALETGSSPGIGAGVGIAGVNPRSQKGGVWRQCSIRCCKRFE